MAPAIHLTSNYSDWTKAQLIERLQKFQRHMDEMDRVGPSPSTETEALKQSEILLEPLTDALPVLISYVDSEQRYRLCNKAYEVWLGHPREWIHGRHLKEVLGDTAYEVIRGYVERALSGETVVYEDTIPYATGGVRNTHAHYVPDFDENDRFPCLATLTPAPARH